MTVLTDTKLFIDGGNPADTDEAARLLKEAGYAGLDGQTTNPSLVAQNPDIKARIEYGDKLSEEELLSKYKEIVENIEKSAAGDISIEVYADKNTKAKDMIAQAREFASWIESAVIKLPITEQGLEAAVTLKQEMKINMTLCFSQQQAAAVHAATKGAKYTVYISPFVGRLDDQGLNGMDLVDNIMEMYAGVNSQVRVLAASIRSVDHILRALQLKTHALTLPFKAVFEPWADMGFIMPDHDYVYPEHGEEILYQTLDLREDWHSFDISHELTDVGLQKFADDWNSLLR